MARAKSGMYEAVIERLFSERYTEGRRAFEFDRDEIVLAATELGIDVAKNPGDVIYSYKYRRVLPDSIRSTAPLGEEWRLVSGGRARYKFVLGKDFRIEPDPALAETKVPDATPGIIARYAFTDEQALLAKLRYNRLVDIFTSVTVYSLQSHLRTSVQPDPERSETMQIETDEVYVGVDRRGAHYVFPVQAKGGRDKIAIQQIEQDVLLCRQKFAGLICVPIAAQFMRDDTIALFAFELIGEEVRKSLERHYRLVPRDDLTDSDLKAYRERLDGERA